RRVATPLDADVGYHRPMEISPPIGYGEVIPLQRNQRVLLPEEGSVPPFFRHSNAIPVTFAEFPAACHHYPLAFVRAGAGTETLPVAVLGLKTGQNLFVSPEGRWQAGAYYPAYGRRHPFCMARVSGEPGAQRLVCVERAALDDRQGTPLFDADGEPVPAWQRIHGLLEEYEADLARTRELCDILSSLNLLEPVTVQAVPAHQPPFHLDGMFRIAENRLETLRAEDLRLLLRKGAMGRIYAHLLSLDHFVRLLDRATAH
ncbi:MAG: SapC family protein, partial [Rhodocyclaceae bacterium]|nr:SapC family protein [Rhodocyclaceae bacterium]